MVGLRSTKNSSMVTGKEGERVDTDAGDSGDDLMVRPGRASVLIASSLSKQGSKILN